MRGARRRGFRGIIDLLAMAAEEYGGDRGPQVAAALAYYALFAVAPLLVLATATVALVYGSADAQARVLAELTRLAGPRIGGILQGVLVAASRPASGIVATVIGSVTLLVGAVGAFLSAQAALDQMWEVEPRPELGLWRKVLLRTPSFLLLVATGVLLLASLAANTAIAAAARFAGTLGMAGTIAVGVAELAATLGLLTVLFALIFKVLPDAQIGWRDVWKGALMTAILVAVGQLLIGLYLGWVTVGSVYGAAGSLIAILLWLNYSAQAFLFGAEFTQVEAAAAGSCIEPSPYARRMTGPCTPPARRSRSRGQK